MHLMVIMIILLIFIVESFIFNFDLDIWFELKFWLLREKIRIQVAYALND